MSGPSAGARLRIVGIPLVALAVLVLAEVDVRPIHYPAVVGEHRAVPASTGGALNRSEPIELTTTAVGLRWPDGGSGDAAIRVGENGVDWGDWAPVHTDEHGPDAGTEESDTGSTTGAVYTGGAAWMQVQWEGGSTPTISYVDTTGSSLGLGERINANAERLAWATDNPVFAQTDEPDILPRSVWGGEACVSPETEYSTRTRAEVLIVHHTIHSASANAYAEDEVPGLLYAICSYHVGVRGWRDIGYNVLIDGSGRIWEGRGGGVDQPVRGAHAAGFNSSSIGLAFIGDHGVAPPSDAAQEAFVAFGAWRLDVAHIDPNSVPLVVSRDSPTYPDGVQVPLRAISGHRDVSSTGCPGSIAYGLIGSLTDRISQVGGSHIYGGWSASDPVVGNRVEGYEPTGFEFDVTTSSSWSFQLTGPDGAVVFTEGGVGTTASIPWAPTASHVNGMYTASIDAIPIDGSLPPRSTSFTFDVGDFEPPFIDDDDSPHQSAIKSVHELDITTGCADLRFCPYDNVERWQMALFLTRTWTASGRALPAPTPGFVDVAEYPEPTKSAIGELAALGIASGVSRERFAPEEVVTRWQMALFLDRLLAALGVQTPEGSPVVFDDLGGHTTELADAVGRLHALGVTSGTSATSFSPDAVVTRQQMAAFLARSVATLSPDIPQS